MKVFVTGATGFIGRHVVGRLVASGHDIVAISRYRGQAQSTPWFDRVDFIAHDLKREALNWQKTGVPDVLIHLAWSGLPNYQEFFHISENLPADLHFLSSAVQAGVPRLIVAGSCLEYGMQYGPLKEDTDTHPITPYGFAKDALRKSLEILQRRKNFALQWVRLFYMYGEGQSQKSLLSQLDQALSEGRETFEMSQGDQLRDYLPIETVARCFEWVVGHAEVKGIINCASGQPIAVVDLVSRHLERRGTKIRLLRGYHPYVDYEPMAFWGVPSKLQTSGFVF